ncbi:MAG: hypothetical protein GF416_06570 [Candidatus Altiarchaeales archaeon]|nr:hypothetical protein [Candidatus Altiarchaeales archaeon]MBD3416779.1 hypothetical protein [Candidatus Altiarchaeales archaeon]
MNFARVVLLVFLTGALTVYVPLLMQMFSDTFESVMFWDMMKSLPDTVQIFMLFSMFIGLAVIAHSFYQITEYVIEYLLPETEFQPLVKTEI